MPEGRPNIPADMDRLVKEEAGHRCAIPTCRATSALEMAHIVPWSKVKEHTFENIILLCAIDHYRFDRGEISVKSMFNYKRNLSVLNARYSDLERRILEWFSQGNAEATLILEGGGLLALSTRNLIVDGLVRVEEAQSAMSVTQPLTTASGRYLGVIADSNRQAYDLTAAGKDFCNRWFNAASLD